VIKHNGHNINKHKNWLLLQRILSQRNPDEEVTAYLISHILREDNNFISIRETNRLITFGKMSGVYSENDKKVNLSLSTP
jgi:hypothetical protein